VKNQFSLFLISLFCVSCFSITSVANEHLTLEGTTDNNMFLLSLSPKAGNAPIGNHHNWVIEVKNIQGEPVSDALFNLSGGMAAHGHGLPSQPLVTKYLGEGQYLIEGMLFNMAGEWSLLVVVQQGDRG